jgi:hypothetical protein
MDKKRVAPMDRESIAFIMMSALLIADLKDTMHKLGIIKR